MLAGIVLMISGLLIAMYPPLLSLIVAFLFISSGFLTLLIAYQGRKYPQEFRSPILRLFFRI
jgi:hypothetical protein